MVAARDPSRQMRENEIIPAEVRDQPIGRRQCYALLPFFGRNAAPDASRGLLFCHSQHDSSSHACPRSETVAMD